MQGDLAMGKRCLACTYSYNYRYISYLPGAVPSLIPADEDFCCPFQLEGGWGRGELTSQIGADAYWGHLPVESSVQIVNRSNKRL